MKTSRHRPPLIAFLVLSSALCPLSSVFPQGSLTPPGAPAPTFKTLQQIEPRTDLQAPTLPAGVTTDANNHFIIGAPGSYYLSANLGVTKTNGIRVNVAGVTVDLNGFEISRSSGSGGDGITIAAAAHRCTVQSGSISGFTDGIDCITATARGCVFRDVSAATCTAIGIRAGEGTVLESCRVHDCSGTAGISTGIAAILINCTAAGNSATSAIQAGAGSSLTNCVASSNTGQYGIDAADGSSLLNCTADSNTLSGVTGAGIVTGIGCILNNCSAHDNTARDGIKAGASSSLTNCTASNNSGTYGIFAGTGSSLTNCAAYNNDSSAATSAGIGTGVGCTITHCTARDNTSTAFSTPTTGMGFDVGNDNMIQGCTASFNQGDGINIPFHTVARDNTCANNGNAAGDGAGIHSTNSDNRIEGNNVTTNDRGIDVDSTSSLIIKNSASGNTTNYEIALSNRYGPIVDITAAGAAAVSGNSAADTTTTTHPWANFTY